MYANHFRQSRIGTFPWSPARRRTAEAERLEDRAFGRPALPAQLDHELAPFQRERKREVERGRLEAQRVDANKPAAGIDCNGGVDAAGGREESSARDAEDEQGETPDQDGGQATHDPS
jgi:hypothetical protein